MPYAPLDDRFDDCASYSECCLAEFGLIACAITYATRNLTDGRIPKVWPTRRFGREGARIASALVSEGIWIVREDGDYEIVGFLDHNPSKAEVLAKRASRSAAGRAGGQKSGEVRRGAHASAYGEANAEAIASQTVKPLHEANAEAGASQTGTTTTTLQLQIQREDPPSAVVPIKVPREPTGDHARVIAAFVEEYGRARGCKPVIAAKDAAGAKKLLTGRTAEEAIAIVRRAFADSFVAEHKPDLAYIAGNVNAFQGQLKPRGAPEGGNPYETPAVLRERAERERKRQEAEKNAVPAPIGDLMAAIGGGRKA